MAGRTSRPGRGGRSGPVPRPSGLARPKGRRRPYGPAHPDDGPPLAGHDHPAAHDDPPGHDHPSGHDRRPGYDQPAGYDQARGYDQPNERPAAYDRPGGYEQPCEPRTGYGPPRRPRPGHPSARRRPPGQDAAHGFEDPGEAPVDDAPRRRVRRPGRTGAIPPVAFFGAAAVVVLIAVVAAVAVFALGSGGGDPRPGGTAVPKVKDVRAEGPGASAYSQAASTAAFAAIADRAKDPRPLTAAETFDPKKITDDDAKASLRLTASSLVSRCETAVWGEDLAGRLKQGGCTQVARAAYEDKDFDTLVTIFNLADDRAADQVVADADPRSGNGFPLVPPKATAFGQGFSIARGVAMGHYAVITWVRRADGGGDERDPALLSLLVTAGKPNAVLVRAAGRDPRP